MAIDMTCQCGKQFTVNDKVAGRRISCPACAVAIDVPTLPALKAGPPPLPKEALKPEPPPLPRDEVRAVRSSLPTDQVRTAPPPRSKPAKPPRRPADTLVPSPVHRYVWLWLVIAAVIPVAILSVVFALYLLLTRTPAAVVAEQGPDNPPAVQQGAPPLKPPPAKVKLKTNVHPQAKPAAEPKTEAQANLAQRVHDVFKANCYRCHGQDGENEGGLNYVVDLRTLVSRNKIVPGKPDDSLVFQRMTAKSRPMPPRSEKVRPTDADIAALKQWIEDGAPSLDSAADDREFIADADILQYIHDDLQKVEERSRRFTRYFTITHLYNAGRSEDELQTFRLALSKLVNSLSWERDIEVPRPIDPARTVVRIDLRHYQWTPEVWKRILGEYPYAVKLPGATPRAVYAATDCDMPYARADWFVFAASRPPLYHDILELPLTDRELEKRLAVDADANLRNEKVARAGFNSSGVSSNNRLIERHRSGYGAYWKSYDFANNQDRKNLFAFPLGPSTVATSFQHDGGEIIFSLPNGLQGYFLTDARGIRIDKGPTSIVRDDRQPDRAVVNGVSCMSCHAQGMIEKVDQVREHVERNAGGFTPDVVATILALYPPRARFAALLKEDAERFAAAVKKTGAHLSTTEPIVALATRYTQELDLPLAAAEAGLDVDAFLKTLKVSPQLARTLGPLSAPGGTVQRDVYVASFGELARLGTGTPQTGPLATYVPGDIFAHIDSEVKANRVKHQEAGWTLFKQVKDMPAEPSILIGFNALKKKGPFDHLIAGLQPIYLTRTGEKTGPWIGNSATEPIVLKAKPGYIVGAMHIKTASTFDAFAVTFVRIEGGRVVASDNYASPWIGGSQGRTATVGGPGALIVGFSGHINQGNDLNAIGALSIRTKE